MGSIWMVIKEQIPMEKGFTITYAYGDNLYVNPTNRCNFNSALYET